ncbi:MAG: hypothetical protein ACRBBW_17190 [Cellvibrionaceae bacterium]
MDIFYCKGDGGFYFSEAETTGDYVTVDEEYYVSIISSQNGAQIEPDENGFPVLNLIVTPLEEAKANKLEEINTGAEQSIISGFSSDALGSEHYYQADRDDQTNLLGMVVAGSDDYFKCRDSAGISSYRFHTIDQLKKVLADGKQVKLSYLMQAQQHKEALALIDDETGTVEQVEAIEVSYS